MVATVPPRIANYAPPPRRRWILITAVAVLSLVVLDAALALAWPRHHKSNPVRFAPPANESALTPTAHELVTLLQRGAGLTVHAFFKAGDGTTLEVWQQSLHLRDDIVQSAGGHTVQATTLSDGKTDRVCVRRDSGPLTCQLVTPTQRQAVGLDGILAAIVDGLGGQSVTAAQSIVGGTEARCFTIGQTKICVAGDGLPVLISGQKVTYELARRSATVDPAVFTPPKS